MQPKGSNLLGHGHGTSVLWCLAQYVGSRCLGPCGPQCLASVDQACSSTSQECLFELECRELGGWLNASSSFHVPQVVAEQSLQAGRLHCPNRGGASDIGKSRCHGGGGGSVKLAPTWILGSKVSQKTTDATRLLIRLIMSVALIWAN